MSEAGVNWSMLVVAIALLVPVALGVVLIVGGSPPLGWALVGFFGAGAVVLGKRAVTGG